MKAQIPGRWRAQGLDAPRWESGLEVVRHLGAVQSQLHDMALWSLGRRCGLTLADLTAEFESLDFRRTHTLRPTWHFIDLNDLPWLQQVSGERVERLSLGGLKPLGVSGADVDSAVEIIRTVVADGKPHTRDDLRAAIEGSGLPTAGQRMAHFAMHAEIRLVMANGAPIGKEQTYLALPPIANYLTADEALTELAIRYGRGHGPFRAKDLAWWSSVTLTTARRAISLADLETTTIDGEEYVLPREQLFDEPPPLAALLSNFDESISYSRDEADYDRIPGGVQEIMRSTGLLFINGRLSGSWRRTLKSGSAQVAVASNVQVTGAIRTAIEQDAEWFARFVDRDLDLMVTEV